MGKTAHRGILAYLGHPPLEKTSRAALCLVAAIVAAAIAVIIAIVVGPVVVKAVAVIIVVGRLHIRI